MVDAKHVSTISLNLTYFFVVLFTVPLFVTVPEWYVSIETVCGVIICGFAVLSAIINIAAMVLARKTPEKAQIKEVFLNKERLVAWCIVAVILISMSLQGMEHLFATYLLFTVVANLAYIIRVKYTA